MMKDKTEIEIAIEYVLLRLHKARSSELISELTDALSSLLQAKVLEEDCHK